MLASSAGTTAVVDRSWTISSTCLFSYLFRAPEFRILGDCPTNQNEPWTRSGAQQATRYLTPPHEDPGSRIGNSPSLSSPLARDRTPSRALVRRIQRRRSSQRRVRQTTTVLGGEDCDLLFMLLLSNRNENDLEYRVMQQDEGCRRDFLARGGVARW